MNKNNFKIAWRNLVKDRQFTFLKRKNGKRRSGSEKVVGASVRNITVLLSQDFLKLVLVSLLIAFPVAAWVLTIGFQAFKAAVANPTKSLRAD